MEKEITLTEEQKQFIEDTKQEIDIKQIEKECDNND